MIRVFVVDDHPVVRQGLVALLEDEPDIQVVGTSDGRADAPDGVDVVLLDLEMPARDGLQWLGTSPGRVIVFTAYDDEERVLQALQAGAQGYLLKGASSEEILRAIHTVHEGGSYIEPRVAGKVLSRMRTPASRLALTPREQDVLAAMARGLSNKAIAAELGITERTVKFHAGGLFAKLGVETRAGAVAAALERRLIPPVRKDRMRD